MNHTIVSHFVRAFTSSVLTISLLVLCPVEAFAQAVLTSETSSVHFNDQRINVQSNPVDFSVTNIGDTPATEISCTVLVRPPFSNPSDPLSFTISTCPTTLVVSASFEINATFTPYKVGPIGATLQIAYHDGAGKAVENISLDGTGFDAPNLFVNGDWSEVNTGYQHIAAGPVTPTLQVPMENRHTGLDLNITAFNQTGASCGQFIFSFPPTPFSLSANTTDFFPVTFNPGTYGTSSCEITFISDDPDLPDTITVTGTGTNQTIVVTPPSHDFGAIGVGGDAVIQDFNIANEGALGELTISNVSLSGTDCDVFALSGVPATPFDLTPGAQALFATEFNPPSPDGYSCTIVILSNDPEASTTNVLLTGEKLPQQIFADSFED